MAFWNRNADPSKLGPPLQRRSFLQGSFAGIALLSLSFEGCESADLDAIPPTQAFDLSGRPRIDLGNDLRIPLIWVESGVCTGCAVALMDSTDPTPEALLTSLRLEFQETLMDWSGPSSLDRLLKVQEEYSGKYGLIVDGAIPTDSFSPLTTLGVGSDGKVWTAAELITRLADKAAWLVALGTCACWGGVCAAPPNPFKHAPLSSIVSRPVVKIPGCPPHAAWIAGTLAAALSGQPLDLDDKGRPKSFYGATVHATCPRKAHFDEGEFATAPGDPTLCLFNVGCKGPTTPGDCTSRGWNGGHSCVGANHPCLGCTKPEFPG